MKNLKAFLLFVGALGCGAEPPMNTDRPDAGTTPDVQMVQDVPSGDDRTAPTPDQPVPPPDAPPPPEDRPLAMVCVAEPAPSTINCRGVLCQPNSVSPVCEGASACDCNMRAEDMPATLCTPEAMPTCMSMVSCSPGRNHCSVNLPENVDYVRFPYMEPDGDGRGGFQNTFMTSWTRADAPSESVGFSGSSLFSERGFVRFCSTLPRDIDGIPAGMIGQGYCAECSGTTCYWNRGALRERAPSIEITVSAQACTIEVRYYLAGNASPATTRTFNSLSDTCS